MRAGNKKICDVFIKKDAFERKSGYSIFGTGFAYMSMKTIEFSTGRIEKMKKANFNMTIESITNNVSTHLTNGKEQVMNKLKQFVKNVPADAETVVKVMKCASIASNIAFASYILPKLKKQAILGAATAASILNPVVTAGLVGVAAGVAGAILVRKYRLNAVQNRVSVKQESKKTIDTRTIQSQVTYEQGKYVYSDKCFEYETI